MNSQQKDEHLNCQAFTWEFSNPVFHLSKQKFAKGNITICLLFEIFIRVNLQNKITSMTSSNNNNLEDKVLKYLFDTLSTNPTQTINCSVSKKENNQVVEFNMSVNFSNPIKSEDSNEAEKVNQQTSNKFKISSVGCIIRLESKNRYTTTMSHALDMNCMFIYQSTGLSPILFQTYDMIKNQCVSVRSKLDLTCEQDLINWTIIHGLVSRQWIIDVKPKDFQIIAEDESIYNAHTFHDFLNTLTLEKINKFRIIVDDSVAYNN